MKNYLRGSPEARLSRLSKKKENSECIEFSGCRNMDGYGRFHFNGKRELAHRASYEIYRGSIPDGQQVLHRCDNPSCINPDHLFLGTVQDNMDDMVAKGRGNGCRGEKHHKAKLNSEKAFEIRWKDALGHRHKDIASEYGVTRALVSMLCRGEIWRPEIHD